MFSTWSFLCDVFTASRQSRNEGNSLFPERPKQWASRSRFFLIVFCNGFLLLEIIANNGLFKKKSKEWGLGHTFFEKTPGVSRFVNLPLVISNKTRSHSWKYRNILLHLTLRNFKAKNQNPRKFHMIFS